MSLVLLLRTRRARFLIMSQAVCFLGVAFLSYTTLNLPLAVDSKAQIIFRISILQKLSHCNQNVRHLLLIINVIRFLGIVHIDHALLKQVYKKRR